MTPFHFTQLSPDLYLYHGAVNTGILKWNERAILIDCDDTLTPARLAELGIAAVEAIYCTQHRRPNTAGCAAFQSAVFAPQAERRQFESAAAYWQDWRNRWHLYHCRPGPHAPLHDIPLGGVVREGDTLQWGCFSISVLETPGMTDGAVSYLVESEATGKVIFSGDVIYAAGQVWDIHSLQKNMGTFSDYHGFLGATRTLIASLNKLGNTPAQWLIPAHGEPIPDPGAAAQLTVQRLEQLYRNYAAISALNFYFPHLFEDLRADPWRMSPAEQHAFPPFIRPVAATSFAILSDSGALFLIDCGHDSVLEKLGVWKEQHLYTQVEGCWVTHYHDDHVDALHHLAAATQAPIYTDEHLAEIITQPQRFFLPCISPAAAPVTHATHDGETWRWREFELTALHFPGQSLYHGGLLLRGHGVSVLFCGDSFAPTGLDDYTAGNRNFLGAEQGYRRCIHLLRRYRPDLILNQHQGKAFHFTDEQLSYMEEMLIARQAMLAELLPWEDPNFGVDEGWLRAYPYEAETCAGASCALEARATNHAAPQTLKVEAVLPPGWSGESHSPSFTKEIGGELLTIASVTLHIPPGVEPGSYPVALRVTWGERYLGQICHAIVKVR